MNQHNINSPIKAVKIKLLIVLLMVVGVFTQCKRENLVTPTPPDITVAFDQDFELKENQTAVIPIYNKGAQEGNLKVKWVNFKPQYCSNCISIDLATLTIGLSDGTEEKAAYFYQEPKARIVELSKQNYTIESKSIVTYEKDKRTHFKCVVFKVSK